MELMMTNMATVQFGVNSWWLQVVLGVVIGGVAGHLFFRSLYISVKSFLSGRSVQALFGHLLRFGLLVPVLLALSQWGGIALLAGTVGLTLARWRVVHSVMNQP